MDELTLLAEMRKDVAPLDTSYPAAHRALLAEISGKTSAPSRRRRRPILISGLVAGTLVAGAGAVAVTSGAEHRAPPTAHTTTSLRLVAVTSPMTLAANATSVAQRAPVPAPTQWFYVKMDVAYSTGPLGKARPPQVSETWSRVDMQRFVVLWQGHKAVDNQPMDNPKCWPSITESYLHSLPTLPDTLLRLIRHNCTLQELTGPNVGPTDLNVFGAVSALMKMYPVLPLRLNAALYGVLARLKSVHLERERDLAGHQVLSLYMITPDSEKTSLLVNPASYAYAGYRAIAVRDQSYRGVVKIHKGDVMQEAAILVSKIVNSPGARS